MHSGVHVACLCWGSTCDAPRDAPSSVPAQPQPSSLGCVSAPKFADARAAGRGPCALGSAGLKSRLQRAASSYWFLGRLTGTFTNHSSPRAGGAWTAELAGADREPSLR